MKPLLGCAAVLLLAAILATMFMCHQPPPPARAVRLASQGPTIERLERLAQLITTRVYVADVLTADGEGYQGAWLIKGDALIGLDLGRAVVADRDDDCRQAVLRLPPPAVLQSRVDHERTRTWEVRKTTWVPWSGNQDALRDAVMYQAQKLVAHAAGSQENLRHARTRAEVVIGGFYAAIGWRVEIRWQDATPTQEPVASDGAAAPSKHPPTRMASPAP
jgi:hypothetical protein